MKRKGVSLMFSFLPKVAPFVFILVLGTLLLVVVPQIMTKILHLSRSTTVVARYIIIGPMVAFIAVVFLSYFNTHTNITNIYIIAILIIFTSFSFFFILKKKREQRE